MRVADWKIFDIYPFLLCESGVIMLDGRKINKRLKKYRDTCIGELSSAEKDEVLRLMAEKIDTDVVNLFVRDVHGGMSSRRMSIPIYLSYLEKTESDVTIGEIIKKLQIE